MRIQTKLPELCWFYCNLKSIVTKKIRERHYVWSTQSKWPCSKKVGIWYTQLDSVGLWMADNISYLVCLITIQLNPAKRSKIHLLAARSFTLHISNIVLEAESKQSYQHSQSVYFNSSDSATRSRTRTSTELLFVRPLFKFINDVLHMFRKWYRKCKQKCLYLCNYFKNNDVNCVVFELKMLKIIQKKDSLLYICWIYNIRIICNWDLLLLQVELLQFSYLGKG